MATLTEKQVEIYAELIAQRLEEIQSNWEKPWIHIQGGVPQNLDGRAYNGVNSLMLNLDTQINGYDYAVYTTFKRAQEEGIRISAGEKGIPIIYSGAIIKDRETDEKITIEEYKKLGLLEKEKYDYIPFSRVTTVFNIDQTNVKDVRPDLWEKLESRMSSGKENHQIDDRFSLPSLDYTLNSNKWIIDIQHSNRDRAYYSPSNQIIHLPNKELFKTSEDYYATALHEMVHSTEVPLNRDIKNYGREELVAELSASIIANQYNFPKHIQENNVQYIKAWIDNIREDPSYLKNILSDVHNASNFVIKEVENKYEESFNKDIASISLYDVNSKEHIETYHVKDSLDFDSLLLSSYQGERNFIVEAKILTDDPQINLDLQRIFNLNLENKERLDRQSPDPSLTQMSLNSVINLEAFKDIASISLYDVNSKEHIETYHVKDPIDFDYMLAASYQGDRSFIVEVVILTKEQELKQELQEVFNTHKERLDRQNSNPSLTQMTLKDNANSKEEEKDNSISKDKNSLDPILMMYANPYIITPSHLKAINFENKELEDLAKQKEITLKEYSISNSSKLLSEKDILEDKMRTLLAKELSIQELPNREQKVQLILEHLERLNIDTTNFDKDRLVHDASYNDIKLIVKEPLSYERFNQLKKDDVDFMVIDDQIQYDARTRYKEGWTMEDTSSNRELLEKRMIDFSPLGSSKLFISTSNPNIGNLSDQQDKLQAISGMGTLPKLNQETLEDRLKNLSELTPNDRERLLSGLSAIVQEKRNPDNLHVYFIDKELNQVRSIDSKSLIIPKESSGILLSSENKTDLLDGKQVNLFDKENHVYHRVSLDPNQYNNLYQEYRTSLNEPFKHIPTPESPDHEKEKYIALKGASGINDIWGREGVKKERDSFLERYQVQEAYREYLKYKAYHDIPQSPISKEVKEADQAIKESIKKQEKNSIGYSR